ncbi:RHS repeat domain-containing protein [Humidesulfovibrio idahonensis]
MPIDKPLSRSPSIHAKCDAKGQRTQKRVNGRVVEAYQWLDPLRLSEFHDGREWWRLAYLKGRTPVGVTNGIDSHFLLCDQVGTALPLATAEGHIVQTMQYDSFGKLLQVRGDAVRLPLGFAGGLFDADTGLARAPFITGWRDDDADTGRFSGALACPFLRSPPRPDDTPRLLG